MRQVGGYIQSIDNLSNNVRDVNSIMVVPVYGHKDKDYEGRKPIAILQFLNKLDFKQISEYDLVSF
jgi:hypothetical protein